MHQLFASFLGSVDRDDDLDARAAQVRAAQRDRLVAVAGALRRGPRRRPARGSAACGSGSRPRTGRTCRSASRRRTASRLAGARRDR